jgi:hypothetical protein
MSTDKESLEKNRKDKLFQKIQNDISLAMKELNTINNSLKQKKKRPRLEKNNLRFEKI